MQSPGQLARSFSLKTMGTKNPMSSMMGRKRLYTFNEGTSQDHNLLGKKGSRICDLQKLDLPVPPGFIISTEAAKEFTQLHEHEDIDRMYEDFRKGVYDLERTTGRKFGGDWKPTSTSEGGSTKSIGGLIKTATSTTKNVTTTVTTEVKSQVLGVDTRRLPLILSVRSSAVQEMPGAMETILNIGLNDDIVSQIARDSDNPRWIYDCYRKLLQMFGNVVYGVDKKRYRTILAAARVDSGVDRDSDLSANDLQRIIQEFQRLATVPEDPWEQLKLAICSIYKSWYSSKADKYRESYGVSSDAGVAVIVQSMVFGNICDRCGVGSAFNRNPNTGEKEFFGEFVPRSSGDDIIGRSDNILTLNEMQKEHPGLFFNLVHVLKMLERHSHELQEIEFTVEQGNLFILQLNKGMHSAYASVNMAVAMVKEKLITEREAIVRLNAKQLDYYMKPQLNLLNQDPGNVNYENQIFGKGLAASMGNATGKLVFSCQAAIDSKENDENCILVLPECLSDDVDGMDAAVGVVTLRGGLTSHAVSWMRSIGKPAITLLQNAALNQKNGQLLSGKGECLRAGDIVTIDGSTGILYQGEIPSEHVGLDEDLFTILGWARKYKKMDVLASAVSVEDIQNAMENGADGIGLLKTEQLFFDRHRVDLVRQIILTDSESDRASALMKLQELQQEQLIQLFHAVGDRELIIRMLDLSLHQMIPDPNDLASREELEALRVRLGLGIGEFQQKMRAFHEPNHFIGVKGCRLGILHPYLVTMQIRAIVGAAITVQKQGIAIKPKILLPTSFSENEVKRLLPLVTESVTQSCVQSAMAVDPKETDIRYDIGVDVATPRACLKLDKFVEGVDSNTVNFANIDTDDLTQLVFGVSKEAAARFMHVFIERHILARDPFESLDSTGVGTLIGIAKERARSFNKNFRVNICGGHSADPNSVSYFNSIGISGLTVTNNKWIPTAIVAAAQAEIKQPSVVATSSLMDSFTHILSM